MNTLYFEKISQFDRKAEPVTVSIPFAAGTLTDPQRLVIRDGDAALPVQSRALATWPDGTVKWLLVHFQPDLPGNRDKTLTFDVDETYQVPENLTGLTVTETPAGIRIDTGPLSFLVPNDGFLPVRDVQLNGEPLWDLTSFKGFVLRYDGQTVDTASGPVELEIEEAGPLRAVILVTGKHRQKDGTPYLDFRGRITAYAGKPYIAVEHQFIHAEEAPELALQGLTFTFQPEPADASPHLALGQGYYRTAIQESDDAPLEMMIDTETVLYQANEHFIDSFYGDFWVDWRDATGGVMLSVYQAHQNFPKKLRVAKDGIVCGLYPDDAPPAPLLQGMAKTHRIQLHFHAPDASLAEGSVRSLQFQLPDRPALSRAWFRANNPWLETFFPEKLPDRLITFLNRIHDGRPKALGMFHFGDAPDAGYTNQGRGQGHSVFVNNEYDRPHACALYYGLTGQRRVLDSALVSARHWLDVDLCHYNPDPLHPRRPEDPHALSRHRRCHAVARMDGRAAGLLLLHRAARGARRGAFGGGEHPPAPGAPAHEDARRDLGARGWVGAARAGGDVDRHGRGALARRGAQIGGDVPRLVRPLRRAAGSVHQSQYAACAVHDLPDGQLLRALPARRAG